MNVVRVLRDQKAIDLAKSLGVWHEIDSRIQKQRVIFLVTCEQWLFVYYHEDGLKANEYESYQDAQDACQEITKLIERDLGPPVTYVTAYGSYH